MHFVLLRAAGAAIASAVFLNERPAGLVRAVLGEAWGAA
jgi:hypothetical protein